MRTLANLGILTENAPRHFALTPLGDVYALERLLCVEAGPRRLTLRAESSNCAMSLPALFEITTLRLKQKVRQTVDDLRDHSSAIGEVAEQHDAILTAPTRCVTRAAETSGL